MKRKSDSWSPQPGSHRTPAGTDWDATGGVPGVGGDGQARLLEVDVGTDQHVAEQEDPALLGLDQLPAVTVHGLRQRLTQEQLPLARGQKLGEETGRGQRQHRSRAGPQTSLRQIPRMVLPRPKGTATGRGGGEAGPRPPPLGARGTGRQPPPSLPAARLQGTEPRPGPRLAVEPSGWCRAACPHLSLLGCPVGDGTKAQVARETRDWLRDLQSPGRGSLRIIKNFKTTMAKH